MTHQLTSRIGTLLSLTLLLTLGFNAKAIAQSAPDLDLTPAVLPTTAAYHATIGLQHAAVLRSRHEAARETVMQNIIVLATVHPGKFDLTPAVPVLLDIYRFDSNQRHRVMAVAALHAIGNRPGMIELNRISASGQSAQVRLHAQNAIGHHFAVQEIERHEHLALLYAAKGKTKKAARHTRKAAWYRSRIGS